MAEIKNRKDKPRCAHLNRPRKGVEVTVYLGHSGKSDAVTMKMQTESPAHVPTKITGDPGMVNYLERDDGEKEPRCPSFDELLAELDARKHERVEEYAARPYVRQRRC